ncbi:MAG: 30S ribosomal protein S2 [Candidatus Shikimatogenerans bostrichidophilus]|nr:MAG: 30S ribosomal protein S2 [Candidatus Shikimatogenerans bostrichidophilus]
MLDIYNKKKLKKIFKKKILLGHKSSNRNPKMSKYILLKYNNIDILNPFKVINKLKKAELILKKCAYIGGIILFVGTKKQISYLIEKYAKKVNMPFINYKWPAGLLTNIKVTRLSIKKKLKIEKNKKNIYKFLSKKEKNIIERKYKKICIKFGSIENMNRLPLFIIIVDVKKEYIVVNEAKKTSIYTIGIVDTDSSPDNIDYIIPANDDSSKSIKYILNKLTNSIIEGLNKREKKKKLSEKIRKK